MDKERLIKALKRSFLISTCFFALTIVLIAVSIAIAGEVIYPDMILRPLLVFTVFIFINAARMYLAGSKWASDKPYILTNILLMPLYLITTMAGICAINDQMSVADLIRFPIIFMIVFTIAQVIRYIIDKRKSDEINDALNEYHKEHPEYGEEI